MSIWNTFFRSILQNILHVSNFIVMMMATLLCEYALSEAVNEEHSQASAAEMCVLKHCQCTLWPHHILSYQKSTQCVKIEQRQITAFALEKQLTGK